MVRSFDLLPEPLLGRRPVNRYRSVCYKNTAIILRYAGIGRSQGFSWAKHTFSPGFSDRLVKNNILSLVFMQPMDLNITRI
jgi:hypothetical protein